MKSVSLPLSGEIGRCMDPERTMEGGRQSPPGTGPFGGSYETPHRCRTLARLLHARIGAERHRLGQQARQVPPEGLGWRQPAHPERSPGIPPTPKRHRHRQRPRRHELPRQRRLRRRPRIPGRTRLRRPLQLQARLALLGHLGPWHPRHRCPPVPVRHDHRLQAAHLHRRLTRHQSRLIHPDRPELRRR